MSALLSFVMTFFAKVATEAFSKWLADRNAKAVGHAEATSKAEAYTRGVQQDITDATRDHPSSRDDLAARARAGGL